MKYLKIRAFFGKNIILNVFQKQDNKQEVVPLIAYYPVNPVSNLLLIIPYPD